MRLWKHRKTLISTLSLLKKSENNGSHVQAVSDTPEHLRPSLCASAPQPASPTTSALLWAWSCLSWESPSRRSNLQVGGPRRKCLWGFWTETRVTRTMIPSTSPGCFPSPVRPGATQGERCGLAEQLQFPRGNDFRFHKKHREEPFWQLWLCLRWRLCLWASVALESQLSPWLERVWESDPKGSRAGSTTRPRRWSHRTLPRPAPGTPTSASEGCGRTAGQ